MIRTIQILYYVIVVEFIIALVSYNDKHLIEWTIMKWIILLTVLSFVVSIIYYFVKNGKLQ